MAGLGRVNEPRRLPGRGKGRGDLSGDMAGLAHSGHDDPAAGSRDRLDRSRKRRPEGAFAGFAKSRLQRFEPDALAL